MVEPPCSCTIAHEADVYHARSLVRRFADSAGASRREAAELEIVASELAWNILRHVGSGTLEVSVTDMPGEGIALILRATDKGPLLDLSAVTQDGWSDEGMLLPEQHFGRRGIGCGLGAVQRLTNHLDQIQKDDGKTIVATRFLLGHTP